MKRCLEGLQACLPKDLSMHVVCKWYVCRNAPGQMNSQCEEWEAFALFLEGLLGIPIAKCLDASGGSAPPKKPRGLDHGSLEVSICSCSAFSLELLDSMIMM